MHVHPRGAYALKFLICKSRVIPRNDERYRHQEPQRTCDDALRVKRKVSLQALISTYRETLILADGPLGEVDGILMGADDTL